MGWLRRLDRHCRLIFLPLSENPDGSLDAVQVISPNGQVLAGWDGIVALMRLFPPLRPLAWLGSLPPIRRLGRRLYRFIAAHRYRLFGRR
jgi:predicted DCC family thiol-disulfide oxidoreductase YuxK